VLNYLKFSQQDDDGATQTAEKRGKSGEIGAKAKSVKQKVQGNMERNIK